MLSKNFSRMVACALVVFTACIGVRCAYAEAYSDPGPIAVWVAGEFDDDKSAHGGLEFALNGNTTNAVGEIVIGNSTTLGATVKVPSGKLPRMTMLVKYSVPAGGAPVAQSVPVSLFSIHDMGAFADKGSSELAGYWLDDSTVSTGSYYAFSDPAQTMPQEGYILISNWTTTTNDYRHGTAVYSGETLSELVGGEKKGFRFAGPDNYITAIGVGGPTVAGAKPWQGMIIKSVALFDEWVATNVIANYEFPAQYKKVDSYTLSPKTNWFTEDASAGDLPQTAGASINGYTIADGALVVDCKHNLPLFYILPTFSGSATTYRIETIIKDLAVNASTNCLPIFEGEGNVPYASIAAAYNEGTNYWYAWNGATWSRLNGSVQPSDGGPYTNAIEFAASDSKLRVSYWVNGESLGTIEHVSATELPSLTKLGFSGYGKFERFSGEGIEASLTLTTTMSLDELIEAGLVTNGFESVSSALAHQDDSGLYGWQKMVLGISTNSGEKPFVAPVQNSSPGSLSFKVGNYRANSNFINKTAKFQVYEVLSTGEAVESGITSGEEFVDVGDTASINLDSVNSVKFFRIKIRFE